MLPSAGAKLFMPSRYTSTTTPRNTKHVWIRRSILLELTSTTVVNKVSVEHGVNFTQAQKRSTRRPDLSTFYSTVNQAYGDEETIQNPNSAPTPENVTASFRLLADAYEIILNEHGGDNDHLRDMISVLETTAGQPPTEREGVPDSFLVDLERVPKSKLKKGEKCPICAENFLDGKFDNLDPIKVSSLRHYTTREICTQKEWQLITCYRV